MAGDVEDNEVLGGHAPWPPAPARGERLDPLRTPPTRGQQRGNSEEVIARRTASKGEGGRLTVHAAYHRVYLKEKVPVEPKSLAQFEGHRAHCTWQAGGVLKHLL